jgi:DNA invertase Pin-like site-specific DNA recombinase
MGIGFKSTSEICMSEIKKEVLHIYVRVSTQAQQDHGTSLDSQRELGIRKASELGFDWKLWDEGGRSSHHEDIAARPMLNQLYTQLIAGDVKHVWVYDQSRISRNDQVASVFRYACNKHGVRLYTKDGAYDLSNPTDKLLTQLMDAVAQFDNASRAERTRLGKIKRVRSGMWHGGPPPFGFKLEKHRLVIEETEAKWVRTIFSEIIKGKSTAQIKRLLDSNAVSTRRNKNTWSIGSIDALVKNTHYRGFYVFTDSKSQTQIQVQCPSIIDEATWSQVDIKRQPDTSRKNQKNATHKNFYLLRDFMFCGHCGRAISGRVIAARAEYSYYCPSRERMWVKEGPSDQAWQRGRGCGFSRSMNLKQAEDLVWDFVKSLHANSSILKEEIRARVYKENGVIVRSEEEFRATKAKLKALQRRHVSLSETLGDLEANRVLKQLNDISYQTMTLRVQAEIREVEVQLDRLRKEVEGATNGKKWNSWLKAFGNQINELDSKTDEEKKTYLSGLIRRIDVKWDEANREHELTLFTHLPIVNDGIVWRDKDKVVGEGRAAIRYDVKEGDSQATIKAKKKDGRG